jgi:methanogenic corrinoid protein MtbC1/DNA-binding XRE family transcriptional regulator
MNVTGTDVARAQRSYLDAVLGEDNSAPSLVMGRLLRDGMAPESAFVDVIAPTQKRIGSLWESGKISVAEEHRATEMAFDQLDQLRRLLPTSPPRGARALVAGVAGNLHSLGARIVADLLAMDGWEIEFLGPNVPSADLVDYVQQRNIALVALSASMKDQIPALVGTTDALRRAVPGIAILAGGLALAEAIRPEDIGADAVAIDAPDAVRKARRFVAGAVNPPLERYLAAVGSRIQQLRRAHSWSQQTLADAAGLDRAYVSSVENGKQNVTVGALKRLADALETPLERLFTSHTGSE